MWVLLVLPLWLSLSAAFLLRSERSGDWRTACARATLYWAAAVVAVSEFLSLCHQLHPGPIRAVWSVISLASVSWAFRNRAEFRRLRRTEHGPMGWEKTLLGIGTGVLILAAALPAVLSPPNTPDALSYHLPRQLMWLQQGSLDHFATSNQRELKMPPFSEMVGVHLQALSGSDRFANLPEFAAYLLSILAVSLLAREIGGSSWAQLLAGFLWASIPMAYLDASSAQNDLTLALWVSLASLEALRLVKKSDALGVCALSLGCAVGLACLTKGTGLVFALPFILLLCIEALKSGAPYWRALFLVIAVGVAICGPHYSRNYLWYGTPFGRAASPDEEEANALFTPSALASNAVRDFAVHLASPSATLNQAIEGAVRRVHRWLALALDDPRTTLLSKQTQFAVAYAPGIEMESSAPAQALLLLLLPLWMLVRRRALNRHAWTLFAVAALNAVLFCSAVKWQPWISRLQLSLFVLGIPILGVLGCAIAGRISGRGWLAAAFAAVAIMPAINGTLRPLWGPGNVFTTGRDELEYRFYPSLREPSREVVALLDSAGTRCARFELSHLYWTYPMLRRLRADRPTMLIWGMKGGPPPDTVVCAAGASRPLKLTQAEYSGPMFAVGDTYPYAVYMSAALLDSGSPECRLPSFVGWTDSENIAVAALHHGPAAVPVLAMVGARGRIRVDSEGGSILVRGVARTLLHPVPLLEIMEGDRRLLAARLDALGEHPFSAMVTKPRGPVWLDLVAGGNHPGERNIIFLRLQVFDPAAVPQALASQR